MRIRFADGTTIEKDATVEIDTALGTLIVEQAGDPDLYPGFYIDLKRPDGNVFSPMLVEVDQHGWSEQPEMKMHYWSPEHQFDDPVWDERLTAEQIDSTWKEREE